MKKPLISDAIPGADPCSTRASENNIAKHMLGIIVLWFKFKIHLCNFAPYTFFKSVGMCCVLYPDSENVSRLEGKDAWKALMQSS